MVLVRALRNGILAPKREIGELELLFATASPGEISAPARKLPAEDKRPWAHVCKHISGARAALTPVDGLHPARHRSVYIHMHCAWQMSAVGTRTNFD